MSGHTPGYWFFMRTHEGAAFDIGAKDGSNVALVSGPDENGSEEFYANAKLIASAPDLLQVCEWVQDHAGIGGDIQKRIKAAIYRAGGTVTEQDATEPLRPEECDCSEAASLHVHCEGCDCVLMQNETATCRSCDDAAALGAAG